MYCPIVTADAVVLRGLEGETEAGVVVAGTVVLPNGAVVVLCCASVVELRYGAVVFANGAVEVGDVAVLLSIRSVPFLKGESWLDGGGTVPAPCVQLPPGTFSV